MRYRIASVHSWPSILLPYPWRFSSHRGKDRSSRSFVMADTVYLRWRTRSHSRLWTSFPQPEVAALGLSSGGPGASAGPDGSDEDPL